MTDSFRPTVIRNKAWEALRGKWGAAAVAYLIYLIIAMACGGLTFLIPFAPALVAIFFLSMLAIGAMFIFLDVANGKDVDINTYKEAFSSYSRYLLGYLLVVVYVFLWSLLLYIPGIIKGLSYSMTFYIMRENPEMKGEEAINRSMAMMDGHKWELFCLCLSFIGWLLLGTITFGVGLLWVYPYMSTAMGAFYEELKKDYDARIAFNAA